MMAEMMGKKGNNIADCQNMLFCDAAVGPRPKDNGKGVHMGRA